MENQDDTIDDLLATRLLACNFAPWKRTSLTQDGYQFLSIQDRIEVFGDMMDSRERVSLAIEHREADRIPTGEIAIADEVVQVFLDVDQVAFSERMEFTSRLGIDAVCESPEWGIPPSRLPKAREARWKDLGSWATRTDRFVFVLIDGAFGWGMRLMGFERFLSAIAKRSQEIIDLIDGVERLNISLARPAADLGANGVLIADDIAYGRGTIVGPDLLRERFFPSLARQIRGIAGTKMPVFFHSDGNLNPVLDDIVELGFQGLHCLESGAGMELPHLKTRYGERICLWGNLDPRDLFPDRGGKLLERKVRDIIRVAAPGGGFIFGTSSGLVAGMRPEHVETVHRVVRSQGRYE